MRYPIILLISLLIILFPSLLKAQDVKFSIISNTSTELVIKVIFSEFTSIPVEVEGETMYRLQMNGAYPVVKAGAPELLKAVKSIIIANEKIPAATLIESDFELIENFELAPSRGVIYRNTDPSTIPFKKGEDYQSDIYFCDNQPVLGEAYQLRELHGVALEVYPFSYNPVSKKLKIYHSLLIKIEYNLPFSQPKLEKNSSEFEEIYTRHFINYQRSRYGSLLEDGEMLILTPDPFVEALIPLKEWKIKTGIPTTIIPLSEIGNTKEEIKNFITNYYNEHNLVFLIIVGDHLLFPYYITGGEVSDNYYTEVAGNDYYPDILLGKISAETVADVETQVTRFINYENSTPEHTHFPIFCGIASREGPGDNNEYDYQHIRNINNRLAAFTYTYGYEFFEGSRGGLDAPGNPTAQMVVDSLNDKGAGIINYCGHGDWDCFATSNFRNYHILQLRNFDKLPFIFSVACLNGDYVGKTCFAETWLRSHVDNKPIGAVGAVMSTMLQEWESPMCAQDEFNNLIVNTQTSQCKRTFGGITFNGFLKMLDVYNDVLTYRTWILFGDPSLSIRTAVSQHLTISYPPSIPKSNSMTVTVSSPNNDAKIILLTRESNITAVALIENGTATFSLPDLAVGDTVFITGTKFNYTPYEGFFTIAPPVSVEENIIFANPIFGQYQFTVPETLLQSNLHYYLYDICGKQLIGNKVTNTHTNLELNRFSDGAYFLKLTDDKGFLYVKKMIK